jgi:D-3-phosphoglycerate dehydrogenase
MSERVKIVVPGDDPVQIAGSPNLERLTPYGDVTIHQTRPRDGAEKIARVGDAAIVINSRGAVTWREAELRALPKLKMITTCSIGTDMIDLAVAKELGIVVSNQPGRTAPAVAEHMFGLMFAVAKRTAFQTAELKAGRWTRALNVMLQGKTCGIVGTGAVGAEMARLARAIGMDVIAWTYNPTPERAEQLGVRFVELDELLRAADVVSLHVKLTDDSRRLIGARELALMKDDAILLNGARGDVVDMAALRDALMAGRFTGAGLDVFSDEPLPADDPILDCEQVVLTPHGADSTPEAVELLNEGAVDNVIAFLDGRPQNNVAV